jgi:DNA-binding phage protein
MKTVKAATTKPYQDSLLQALRDPVQASAYLQAALEESAVEPELLQAVLQDIDAALAPNPQNIAAIVNQPLHQALPTLISWLDDLGLQLLIASKP